MKAFLFLVALTLSAASFAHAQEKIDIPPERQDEAKKVVMRLVFADQCDKRLDMPEMLIDAKTVALRFFQSIDAPDPEGIVAKIGKSLAEKPQEKEEGPFTLFNPKLCGEAATSLKNDVNG